MADIFKSAKFNLGDMVKISAYFNGAVELELPHRIIGRGHDGYRLLYVVACETSGYGIRFDNLTAGCREIDVLPEILTTQGYLLGENSIELFGNQTQISANKLNQDDVCAGFSLL
jgi:hypothetical protein